jgi:hypothetical protein
MRGQTISQATKMTIEGLTETPAAIISHCFQIGTVPMRRGPCRANLGHVTPVTVDDRLKEDRAQISRGLAVRLRQINRERAPEEHAERPRGRIGPAASGRSGLRDRVF